MDSQTEALHRVIPRSYIDHANDLCALCGSVGVVRRFMRHNAKPSRLSYRFGDLSLDIALSRITKANLTRLMRVSRSSRKQLWLWELLFTYADISTPPRSEWDDFVMD